MTLHYNKIKKLNKYIYNTGLFEFKILKFIIKRLLLVKFF